MEYINTDTCDGLSIKLLGLLTSLDESGFYGIEYYEEIEKLTKGTNMEECLPKLKECLNDINTRSLDDILKLDSAKFDDIRLEIIIERIKKDNPDYTVKLHKKIFNMFANDDLSDEMRLNMADIMLKHFY